MGGTARARRHELAAKAVAQVVYSAGALDALERTLTQLRPDDAAAALAASSIRSAVDCHGAHPFLGRRIEEDVRELIISYGASGYIALYRFVVQRDEVRVLALRSQREIGYLP